MSQEKFRRSMNKRLSAVFTVEMSYLTAMILFVLAFLILLSYKKRAFTSAGFVTHFVSARLQSTEEFYAMEPEDIREKARHMIRGIAFLETADIFLERDKKILSEIKKGEIRVRIQSDLFDPEKYLRMHSVAEDIYEGYKNRIPQDTEP